MRSTPIPVFVLVAGLLLGTGCGGGGETDQETNGQETDGVVLTEMWRLEEGLDRPESVIFDAERNRLYVSNLVGGGDEMDGVGYIATVSPEGEMLDADWVDGLNAPKGLALGEGVLYATDIDALLAIDLDTGEITARHVVEGDAYLNDVTVGPDGAVYASDSRYSRIYVLGDDSLEVWLEDDAVQMPNGVHVVGDELYVAAGDDRTEDPGTARYLQAISLTDRSVRPLAESTPVGALDAVEPDDAAGLFVTDWGTGRLMHFNGSELVLLEELGQGAADVDYVASESMLYVPVMMEHELIAYQVSL